MKKLIDPPLNQVFDFESTYCLCVRGIPNRPDNTVIEGLGQIPQIEIPVDDFYHTLGNEARITQITEPSLGLFSVCLLSVIASVIKRG